MEAEEDFSHTSSESESDDERGTKDLYSSKPENHFLKFGVQEKKSKNESSKDKDSRKRLKLSSSLQPGITFSNTYLSIFPHYQPEEVKDKLQQLSLVSRLSELESKNIVAQPGFEKQHTVPPYIEGRKKIRRERLKERDKTKGAPWFNIPATEVTEEIKNDLAVLQMRNSLDPKRFYKRGNEKICPKYFKVGTVVESPIDFYHARIPKKQRKRTLVEELLADAEFRKYQKRKYTEALKNMPAKFYHSSQKKKQKKMEKMKSKKGISGKSTTKQKGKKTR